MQAQKWNPATSASAFDSGANYAGQDYRDWYVCYAKTRDSGLMQQHNFDEFWKVMRTIPDIDVDGEASIQVVRHGHWACGWVEYIMVHQSHQEALDKANDILAEIDDYPLLNEDGYSELCHEYALELWSNLPLSERIEYLNKAQESIFAARDKDSFPYDVQEHLLVDAE